MSRPRSSWLLAPGATMLCGCLLLADPPELVDASTPSEGWIDVAVRSSVVCALQADGSLWCGGGPRALRHHDEGPFVAISQGGDGSLCGVYEDGRLFCSDGIEGGFTLEGSYVDVVGGGDAGCGLLADGRAQCWPESTNVSGPFSAIGAGERFACGIREGSASLSCWSIDDVIFDEPLTDVPLGSFAQVTTSDQVGCAIATSGTVTCWGYDFYGLLTGPPAGRYSHVALSSDAGCGISDTGSVACWGERATVLQGQIPPDVAFEHLDLGAYDGACGIDTESGLHCW